jgi:hypothetical protein
MALSSCDPPDQWSWLPFGFLQTLVSKHFIGTSTSGNEVALLFLSPNLCRHGATYVRVIGIQMFDINSSGVPTQSDTSPISFHVLDRSTASLYKILVKPFSREFMTHNLSKYQIILDKCFIIPISNKNLNKHCSLVIFFLGTIFAKGHPLGGDYFDMPVKFGSTF